MSDEQLSDFFGSFSSFLKSGEFGELSENFLTEESKKINQYLAIYRNGFVKASVEALKNSYPVVVNMLGEDYFMGLARTYAVNNPSSTGTLVGYGEGFSEYLVQNSKLPYISSVARLDKAWLQTLNSVDDQPLTAEDLAEISESGGDIDQLELSLNGSVSVMENDYQIFDLWVQIKSGNDIQSQVEINNQKETLLFWKQGLEVRAKVLSDSELLFIDLLNSGNKLGAIAEQITARFGDEEVSETFSNLLVSGILKR